MNDLISREGLIKEVCGKCDGACDCCCEENCIQCKRPNMRCDFRKDLDEAPTVDAVPVVHGRWIEDYETFVQDNGYESEPIHTGFVCSVCGRHSCSIEPYCHCGAKMDGGNEE